MSRNTLEHLWSSQKLSKIFQTFNCVLEGVSKHLRTPLKLSKALENLIKALAEHADVIRGWVVLKSDFETFKILLILDEKKCYWIYYGISKAVFTILNDKIRCIDKKVISCIQNLTSSLQNGGQNEVISLNYRYRFVLTSQLNNTTQYT